MSQKLSQKVSNIGSQICFVFFEKAENQSRIAAGRRSVPSGSSEDAIIVSNGLHLRSKLRGVSQHDTHFEYLSVDC